MSEIVLFSHSEKTGDEPVHLHFDGRFRGCHLRIEPSAGDGLHLHVVQDEPSGYGLRGKDGLAEVQAPRRSKFTVLWIAAVSMVLGWAGANVGQAIAHKSDAEPVARASAVSPAPEYSEGDKSFPQAGNRVAGSSSQPEAQLKAVTENLRRPPIITPAPGANPKAPSGPAAFGLE
jgi:hypothetical protein